MVFLLDPTSGPTKEGELERVAPEAPCGFDIAGFDNDGLGGVEKPSRRESEGVRR